MFTAKRPTFRPISILSRLLVLLLCCVGIANAALANDAATTWRLLDYLAVDYGGAVADGRIVNEAEYAEMREFSATVKAKIEALPASAEQPQLVTTAAQLIQLIESKAPATAVDQAARSLAQRLIAAYPVPLAPSAVPDLARGAKLYSEQCAGCHGTQGGGDGPASTGMDPPPIAFADETRARQRSVFALYQVIEQGLDGTAMASYAHLPAEDRWALAFHVGQFAYPQSLEAGGQKAWGNDAAMREQVQNLEQLVQITPATLEAALGEEPGRAVTAYLRRNPAAVLPAAGGTLSLSRERLGQAVAAYGAGDARGAADAALSAYLDGFEPVEPLLAARDPRLLTDIEAAMLELRARIGRNAAADDVRAQADVSAALFAKAEAALAPDQASGIAAFVGSFTILLREGLEALLIVVAIVAFLRKAQRTEAMGYVHAGWIGALVAGTLTWGLATYVVGISGAQREVTEGIGGLFAAVVLVSVGLWMHQKSLAGRWQQYLTDKLSHALSKRSSWFLFSLCFVAVYREVFETILFYAAMWTPQTVRPITAGFGAAAAALALTAWAMLRFSRQIPIGRFFSVSSLLIAVLAIVLTGKGVAALQEAGWFGVQPLAVPRIEWLGVYPSAQVVGAQLTALIVLACGFAFNRAVAQRDVRHST